jgi:hypothetical protein
MSDNTFTPEYLQYLDRRYNDIKQVLEAVLGYFPYKALEENHLVDTLEAEFDYLADILGYEDLGTFLDRLLENMDGERDE